MQFACLALIARRHLLVCPRTVRDGAFEQSTIFEVISEDRFEEIQIRNRFGIFQNALNYKQNAGSLSKKASGAGMETNALWITDGYVVVEPAWFRLAWFRPVK